ncbi:unnamed protein product [Arctogadus glacialis]
MQQAPSYRPPWWSVGEPGSVCAGVISGFEWLSFGREFLGVCPSTVIQEARGERDEMRTATPNELRVPRRVSVSFGYTGSLLSYYPQAGSVIRRAPSVRPSSDAGPPTHPFQNI